MQTKTVVLAAALSFAPGLLQAQFDFTLWDRKVQIHSFAQQGFALSNDNNYLTMKTSQGSFAMTDGGVNISTSLTDKFRVGAQLYDRNIGELGRGTARLDWAYGDYKFKDWFGIRAGKVKTSLGLFNDTQDMEFLQTWALLPQSLYPLDLRSNTIAHTGGDVYGDISLHKAGSVSYTAYAGLRQNDTHGGLYYTAASGSVPVQSFSGRTEGADIRWRTPVAGLMIGASWANQTVDEKLLYQAYNAVLQIHSTPEHLASGYADYVHGKWHFSGEFRRDYNIDTYTLLGAPGATDQSTKAWFVAGAYRVSKWLELGTYHSRFYVDVPQVPGDLNSNHIFDQTVTARFDITRWWNVKVEGHFMKGYGDTYSAHGFYAVDNPTGLKPNTNMFVIRTGYNM